MSLHFDAYAYRKQWNHAASCQASFTLPVHVTYTRNYATCNSNQQNRRPGITECVSANTKCERKRLSRSRHPQISPFPLDRNIQVLRQGIQMAIDLSREILIHGADAVKSAVLLIGKKRKSRIQCLYIFQYR